MKPYLFFLAAISSLFTLVNTVSGAPFVLSDVVTNSHAGLFLAVGDVNGDEKPDLVSVNSDSTFTIATNAGNGIFFSNATYNVGHNNDPAAAAIADINGDGKADVITMNVGNNTVTIFTNAGGGIFVSNASYVVGNYPFSLLVTNINGDGKPDIITANANDGTLSILTNAGGTFPVLQTVLVVNSNSFASCFAVADLNGDGKPDLIAGDYNDGLIEVLTNAGGGIFVSNAVYTAGSSNGEGPLSIVAADFNNDGRMDVVCGNQDGTVTVFTNAGNGILAQAQSFSVPGYPNINSDYTIMAADVDGDGYPDLLVNGDAHNTAVLMTLYNSGEGAIFITNYLNSTNVVNTLTAPGQLEWAVATDINGDGKPDAAGVLNYFYVYTNGIGSFPNSISINVYSNLNAAPVTNITAEATSASGAVVNFITTATNWTGSWPVTNTPPSGSTFPVGITTVTSSMGYFVKSNIFGSANTNFTVTVVDTNLPVITLLGPNPWTNFVNGYFDPGATATDPIYGNLTGSIVVSGNLNTNVPGIYTVTYSVTDPAGNSAMTNRTVAIIPLPPLGVASTPGNQVALFWPPGSDTNYVLQTTTNLATGNWANVTNGQPLIGVYVSNTAPAAFFRLQPQ